jgi:hypothetical protein
VKHDGSGSSGDTRPLAVVVKPLTVDVDLLAMDAEPRAAIGVDLVRSPASAVGITPAATVAFGRSGRGPHQRPRTGRKRETPCSSGKSSTRERTRCEEEEEEVSAAAAGIGLLPSPPEGESRVARRRSRGAGLILVANLLGPEEVFFFYFRRFWPKAGVKIVASTVVIKQQIRPVSEKLPDLY